jgi:hypothetical protein
VQVRRATRASREPVKVEYDDEAPSTPSSAKGKGAAQGGSVLSVAAVVGSSSSGGANVTTPPARKRVKAESGGTPTQPVVAAHSPPSNWPQVLQGIQQMRLPGGAAAGAAVDSMGCDRCHEETVEPPEMRFQVLPSHTSLGWALPLWMSLCSLSPPG